MCCLYNSKYYLKRISMNKQSSMQRGDAMTVTIIIIVIAIIGALGYVAWKNLNKDDTAVELSTPVQQDATDPAADEDKSFEGERVSAVDGSYSLKVPNGWELYRTTTTGEDSIIASGPGASGVVYNKDKAPVVSDVDGAPSSAPFAISVVASPRDDMGSKADFVVGDGMKATKATKEDKNTGMDASNPEDWYYRTYVFTKGDKTVELRWSQGLAAGASIDPELYELLDNIARTVRL